jgi:hypothetical protein
MDRVMRFTRHGLDCHAKFLELSLLCRGAGHRFDSSGRGKISRKRKDQQGLTFCKVVSGRCWRRSGVTNDLALHEIDHQLGDIGGMIGDPFEIFGNEA